MYYNKFRMNTSY